MKKGQTYIYDDPKIEVAVKLTPGEARKMRMYIEAAAAHMERYQANATYRFAFRRAARLLRQMKPD